MRIENYIHTTPEEIDSRRWNPYLAISINKKTFTRCYIDAFINWALPRSREKVAIVIVDVLQQINNQVLGPYKPAAAIEKAFRKADEIHLICQQAIAELTDDERSRLLVLEWPDIIEERFFLHNARLFKRAYAEDPAFRDALMGVSRQNLGAILERLGVEQLEHISRYMLYELPELVTGFVYDGCHFNLKVYPGALVSLYQQLSVLDCFARITPELLHIGPSASIEAYAEGS